MFITGGREVGREARERKVRREGRGSLCTYERDGSGRRRRERGGCREGWKCEENIQRGGESDTTRGLATEVKVEKRF